jgi:predicted ferric reductase
MKRAIGAIALVSLYLVVGLAPLSFMFTTNQPPRPFLIELSVALGFVGLSMMGLQFAVVARFRSIAAPFGIDVLYRFHREVSYVALVFILVHPLLLFLQNAAHYLPLLVLTSAPWRARFGVASVVLLVALVALSVLRRRLRIAYWVWQLTHGLLAVVVIVLALAHIDGVGYYTAGPVRRAVFDVMAGALVAVVLWARVVAPLTRMRRPWRVVRVYPERAGSTTVTLEPIGHDGFVFRPGQFAWVSHWPVSISQHPFSFSSPGDGRPGGPVAMTIKAFGGWTRRVGSLASGNRIYLDGPHGAFSMDLHQAEGYGFIAAGVGITPLFSMLSTMCVRGDVRPVILVYVNRDWDTVIFREQLDEMALDMPNLRVVHVLRKPPLGWRGERGRLNADLLRRHLPDRQYRRFAYFICGPEALMDDAEDALLAIGVPSEQVHSERFAMA